MYLNTNINELTKPNYFYKKIILNHNLIQEEQDLISVLKSVLKSISFLIKNYLYFFKQKEKLLMKDSVFSSFIIPNLLKSISYFFEIKGKKFSKYSANKEILLDERRKNNSFISPKNNNKNNILEIPGRIKYGYLMYHIFSKVFLYLIGIKKFNIIVNSVYTLFLICKKYINKLEQIIIKKDKKYSLTKEKENFNFNFLRGREFFLLYSDKNISSFQYFFNKGILFLNIPLMSSIFFYAKNLNISYKIRSYFFFLLYLKKLQKSNLFLFFYLIFSFFKFFFFFFFFY